MVKLTLNTKPKPKGRPRFTRGGRAYTPKATKEYETTLRAMALEQYIGKPLEGPIGVSMQFTFIKPKSSKRTHPTVTPDIDNLIKAVLDSIQGITFIDDKQIVEIHATEKYGLTEETRVKLWNVD